VSGQLHDPTALPPKKEPRYPSDRSLGGPQSQSVRTGEEKNYQSLRGTEHRRHLFTIPTELPRLLVLNDYNLLRVFLPLLEP
jgi:hypothetical protein